MVQRVNRRAALEKRLKETAPVRLIVISFLLIIIAGTILLWLPISSRNGSFSNIVDALFTATSATCVTGLVVFDTWTHWNFFGQVVIIMLIQVGGLGLATITTGFALLLRKKLGLKELLLASESASGDSLDVGRLIKMVLHFTFSCESVGALLLMIRFIPKFGIRGLWVSIFESISAFCNAGFDILGFEKPNASLMGYVGDPLVCVTIAFLIMIGVIGFVVVSDVYYGQLKPRFHHEKASHLNFHSEVCLLTTAILVLVGTVLFFGLEYDNTMAGMNFGTRLNASFFQSVSARTAGFASIDIGKEHDFTKIVTIILMFIGACPGSTGGGIKVTTFVVLVSTVWSVMRGREDAVYRKRRIEKSVVYRSLAIFSAAFFLVLVATGVILTLNDKATGVDALFESVSAFGTVGLTAGLTPYLHPVSKLVLSFVMFSGRVGPVSLMMAITLRFVHRSGAVLPEGHLIVG